MSLISRINDLADRIGVEVKLVKSYALPTVFTQTDVTGASVSIPGLPESPAKISVYRDRMRLFPSEYSIPPGGGQVNFTVALADESVLIEYTP
jgi:hypothetical protein